MKLLPASAKYANGRDLGIIFPIMHVQLNMIVLIYIWMLVELRLTDSVASLKTTSGSLVMPDLKKIIKVGTDIGLVYLSNIWWKWGLNISV